MLSSDERLRLYQARLSRWTRQFSHGSADIRPAELDGQSSLDEVRSFVEENLAKRREKIEAFCGLLDETLAGLGRWITAYVRAVGAAPCRTARADALQFLDWLEPRCLLHGDRHDSLVCERSRLEVEVRARKHRLEYVRFAELRTVVDRQLASLATDGDRRLLLNPTRVRGVLTTRRFLDESTPLPATVLFLAVDEDLRTCLLEGEGLAVVDALEAAPRCSFRALAEAVPGIPDDELLDHCRELAAHGVLAVE
jgi:hypothetical protein